MKKKHVFSNRLEILMESNFYARWFQDDIHARELVPVYTNSKTNSNEQLWISLIMKISQIKSQKPAS